MLFIFICLVITLIVVFLWYDTVKPKDFPPGPAWLPIVGNFLEFRKKLENLGYHHLVWESYFRQYGEVVGVKMGRNLVVTVFGPNAIKEVLTREEFDGRPDGYFFKLRTFGKRLGIVFSDGQFWQKQRKFSVQHLKNFGFGRKEMEERIEEETRNLIGFFKKESAYPIWMHKAFGVSVLNVLWAMMAGTRFEVNDKRLLKLMDIIHDAFKLNDMSGGLLNQMPFLRFFVPNTCGYNMTLNVTNRMWEFFQETIVDHKNTLCSSHARDLIDAFLQRMNKRDATFTDDQLISLCLDLFMAGSETTSNTLSFAVLYMLLYPDVQKEVQNELNKVVGRNRWPVLQDRTKLKYTEAVLMEIQRRVNVPPLGIAHRAVRNATLFGHNIPKGSIILTSLYNIHMNSDFWKDPEAFRPERFLDESGNLTFSESHFAPFGNGKRRCLGESLAKASSFMFFSSLLHNFNLERDPEGPPLDQEPLDGVTLSPKPFTVKLIVRND